ncbi:hypothetical protein P20495_0037 [Pseudoalteromonas sp. BSi20495]|nr:hypothetical protein P20495_0037 [Pseudoalteromonas sp. BSi20495]
MHIERIFCFITQLKNNLRPELIQKYKKRSMNYLIFILVNKKPAEAGF